MPGEGAEGTISQMESAYAAKNYPQLIELSDRLAGETDDPKALERGFSIGRGDPSVIEEAWKRVDQLNDADAPAEARSPLILRALEKARRYGAFEDEDRRHSAIILAEAYGLDIKKLLPETEEQAEPEAAPTAEATAQAATEGDTGTEGGDEEEPVPQEDRVLQAIANFGSLDAAIAITEAAIGSTKPGSDVNENLIQLLEGLNAYKDSQEQTPPPDDLEPEEDLDTTPPTEVLDLTDEEADMQGEVARVGESLTRNEKIAVRITPEIFARLSERSGFPFIKGVKLRDCRAALVSSAGVPELRVGLDLTTVEIADLKNLFRSGLRRQNNSSSIGLSFRAPEDGDYIRSAEFNPPDGDGKELGLTTSDHKGLKDSASRLHDIVAESLRILLSQYFKSLNPFRPTSISVSKFKLDAANNRLSLVLKRNQT